MTGESWSEAVARPLLFSDNGYFVSFYFVSFICLLQIILLNVFVAVLLEKFLGDTDEGAPELDASALLEVDVPTNLVPSASETPGVALGAANALPPSTSEYRQSSDALHGTDSAAAIHAKLDLLLSRDDALTKQLKALKTQVDSLTQAQQMRPQQPPSSRTFGIFSRRDESAEVVSA
jgi:hypothetical protein